MPPNKIKCEVAENKIRIMPLETKFIGPLDSLKYKNEF